MDVVRQAGALLLAALVSSRGLFAQGPEDLSATLAATARDEVRVALRPVEIRYVHQEPLFLPAPRAVRALYVNAWAFGSPKLWHLVRLVEGTEINAFVVDVKDDTGCLLYPSAVPTAREIGAGACARARDAKARLDTLAVHGIYAIARIVVAKDPLLAERKPAWSVKNRETGELWRDRIDIAWVDAYNDSVWIYAAQLAAEAVRMGFQEVQFDYVRFPTSRASGWPPPSFPPAGPARRSATPCARMSACCATASSRSACPSPSTSSASPPRLRETSASARCGRTSPPSPTSSCPWCTRAITIVAPSASPGRTASPTALSRAPCATPSSARARSNAPPPSARSSRPSPWVAAGRATRPTRSASRFAPPGTWASRRGCCGTPAACTRARRCAH